MLDFSHIPDSNKNVQTFYAATPIAGTSWQTWVKPRGVSFVHFFVLGGGGGGGSGRQSVSQRNAAGGGSSAQCSLIFPTESIPDVLYVSVGVGGAGGTTALPGVGGTGQASYVSISTSTAVNYVLCRANGGGGSVDFSAGGFGAGGTVTTIAQAPLAGLGFPAWGQAATNISLVGQAGTASSVAGPGVNLTLPVTGLRVTGGTGAGGNGADGGGGFAGGSFAAPAGSGVFPAQIGGTGGSATSNGTAGSNGFQAIANLLYFYGGTGGGSGGRNAVTTGGNGGAGGYGCGGGGGGGAFTGGTFGSGGRGGDGLVIATAW